MAASWEKRIHGRSYVKAPIMYARYKENQYCFYAAQMYNFSSGGLYFESGYPLQKGTFISIRKANYSPESQAEAAYTELRAEVKWCKEIGCSDKAFYGAGVKYFKPVSEPPFF